MRSVAVAILASMLLFGVQARAQQCYEASIVSPSPFMGNDGEIFKLDDGSLWEVKYEYEYLYEYLPSVIMCPSKGKLVINGKQLNVQRLSSDARPSARAIRPAVPASPTAVQRPVRPEPSSTERQVIESQIDGDFEGWGGETIFKLVNGQIWQQSTYAYTYSYKFMPKVLIVPVRSGFEMHVDGVEGKIAVTRLK